ncbi:MAG: flagellar biosynthesis protein FlhF [Rehaibacterium terrae]|uniref:flagellar biosynthesis protein FlhF n=1 Tax=Rehaibacterium terrae TaxID=1341696 RepID=UPI00391DB05D
MRIKRFQAPDMRTALRLVRDEQGPHAVILSSSHVDGGVEVVAATDYDEALMRQAMRPALDVTQAKPEAPAAERPAGDQTLPEVHCRAVAGPGARARREEAAERAALRAIPVPVTQVEDPAIAEVRRELAAMREMIEREMGRFAEERLRGVPVRAQALDELAAYGCEVELARSIVASIPADADRGRARGLMLGLLAKSLVIPARDPLEQGGVVALVGPTGVGKTTTIAKLAARYAAARSPRDVALVTTDTYRVGGREQLATYGRLLGMPVFEAGGEQGLPELLDRLADYPLVLVDTAGLGQRDRALAARFNWMGAARRLRSWLVLPANAQAEDLDEVVRRFRCAAPEGVILTKLDETGRLGAALSVVIRHRLPLGYIADGQRVPEDLHRAEAHRLVLRLGELRRAAEQPVTTTEKADAAA